MYECYPNLNARENNINIQYLSNFCSCVQHGRLSSPSFDNYVTYVGCLRQVSFFIFFFLLVITWKLAHVPQGHAAFLFVWHESMQSWNHVRPKEHIVLTINLHLKLPSPQDFAKHKLTSCLNHPLPISPTRWEFSQIFLIARPTVKAFAKWEFKLTNRTAISHHHPSWSPTNLPKVENFSHHFQESLI